MLHIASIGDTWTPLTDFASQLEIDLKARVQVNLHAGFATSHGFDTHWDGHDVLAIQIAGRKKWRMFGITEVAPLPVPPDLKTGAPSKSCWEGVLERGDLLYIPRGYWHSAQALDDASLHLTFAIQNPTSVDFLDWLLTESTKDELMRKDIPISLFETRKSQSSKQEYIERVKSVFLAAISIDKLNSFLNEYQSKLGRNNSIDLNRLGRIGNANTEL